MHERHGDEELSAEDHVMRTELDGVVAEALAGVSGDFRQVIVLVDIDGLSYAEAAAYLGIPEGTVMSRLHRARKKIRDRVVAKRVAIKEESRHE